MVLDNLNHTEWSITTDFCTCQNAMKVMCFTEEEIADVLQVIAGVLQLGNVNFMAAGGAQVAEKSGM